MLGANSFVKAGWVQDLRAHVFKHDEGDCWLVKGMVIASASIRLLYPIPACIRTGLHVLIIR